MAGRHDLAEHFFVSAAIAGGASRIPAEAAGLGKEMRDADGESGFSFSDWAADLAGIAFAERVMNGALPLADLAKNFDVADYFPDVSDLADNLPRAEFTSRFGASNDKRFRQVDSQLRRRIAELPAYRSPKSDP